MIEAIAYFRRRASRRIVRDLPADLAAMEDDQPLMMLGRVREVIAHDQVSEKGRSPPVRTARFGIPAAPSSSRPRSAAGEQSFHFALDRQSGRTARVFDTYLTDRDQVAERGTADVADAEQAPQLAAHFDAYVLGHGGEAGGVPAVVTTLHADPSIRRAQLDQIEAHELVKRRTTSAGVARINLRYELAPDLLLGIARRADCPPGLRALIHAERDRIAEGRALPKRRAADGMPWVDPGAPAAMAMIAADSGFATWRNRKRQPAKLSLGRGTRPVLSGEFEFPTGLDPAARHRVMLGLNAFVQRQRPGGAGDALVPFVGVEHLPDALNDRRNPHGHFIIGKSLVTIGDGDTLTIAPTTLPALTSITIVKRLRGELACLMNDELDRCAASYRLSPETFAAMGIDATAQTKLRRDRTILERAGVATDAGIDNAIEGWRRVLQAAQGRHDEGAALLTRRHSTLADDIAVHDDDDDHRRRLAAERARAESDQRRALLLRHEAEEIGILCDMATSRATLTDRFAPGYAAVAATRAGGRLASHWTARGGEAAAYLAGLAVELAGERAAIAAREHLAVTLEAQATTRLQAIEEAVRRAPAANRTERDEAQSPHRAVQIIAKAPLMISRQGDRYHVRDVDDPDGLVRGIPLTGVSQRLKGVHRAQQNELRQITAYVSRHGPAGLDEDQIANADGWVRRTVGKWRQTPAMVRIVADWRRRRLTGNPAYRRMVAEHAAVDDERSGALRQGPPTRLPTLGDLTAERLRQQGIVLAPAAPRAPPPPAAAPGLAAPDELHRPAPPVSPPSMAPMPSVPVETDPVRHQLEERLRQSLQWRRERDRRETQADLDRALAQRAGDATRLPPHPARLLKRIAAGFDPGKHPSPLASHDRTLEQLDAIEIGVLSHQPLFASRVVEARRGDPTLMALIERSLRDAPPDKLGLVALIDGKVRYDGERVAGATMRSPHYLARRALPGLDHEGLAMSRHRSLTGVHDRRVVRAMQGNVVGLLYPDIQTQLEAWRRLQLEEELAFLSDVAAGRLRIKTEIKDDRVVGVSAYVWLSGETPEQRRVGKRRLGDGAFYLDCRAAQEDGAPPLRHPDAAARALLRAHDDGAGGIVVALLREEVLKLGANAMFGVKPADAAALAALLRPAATLAPIAGCRPQRYRGPPRSPGRTLR